MCHIRRTTPCIRAAKSAKRLRWSAALLAHCREGSEWEAHEAWTDLVSRGLGWQTRALRGLKAVERLAPELALSDWLANP